MRDCSRAGIARQPSEARPALWPGQPVAATAPAWDTIRNPRRISVMSRAAPGRPGQDRGPTTRSASLKAGVEGAGTTRGEDVGPEVARGPFVQKHLGGSRLALA